MAVFSVHPGWIRSNLTATVMPGSLNDVLNVILRLFGGPLGTMSPFEGAQTTLHCLLDDDTPAHSGERYGQPGVLYPNQQDRSGGRPMGLPNPHAHDADLAERRYRRSLELVGLDSAA